MSYQDFLNEKFHRGCDSGFEPVFMPDALMDFQRDMVDWAVRKGRAALFEDCGLGKTLQQLVWAENVHRHTNKPVLILTPLAVSTQSIREGQKFDIECARSSDGKPHTGITITNYEQLHKFNPDDFAGVVCDESSILKNFDGARKKEITKFMRKIDYRLLATATAAPNDYTELGTSSEALGYMGNMDMLTKFFKNDQNNCATKRMYGEAPKWRFKGHAELMFWRWVVTWARAIRNPSDIGYSDADLILPPLHVNNHSITPKDAPEGSLFTLPAVTLREQREESKRTIAERCDAVANIVNAKKEPSLVWCNRNDEGNMLEAELDNAIQISGSDSDESKEEKFLAFLDGQAEVLITKPRIGAWGLNFQHCAHMTYFPTHSFEGYYQAIRRCWRFGQKNPVTVDIILTEGEKRIMDNLRHKEASASSMFDNLIKEMSNAETIQTLTHFDKKEELPSWL
jgi:hypothetical protein